jgi:hypothetical protein
MTWAGLVQLCDAGAEPSVPPSPPDEGCPPPSPPDEGCPPPDDVLPDEPPDDDAPPEDDAVPEEPEEPEEDEEAPDEDATPDDDELLDDEAPVSVPLSPHPVAQASSKPRTEAGRRCRTPAGRPDVFMFAGFMGQGVGAGLAIDGSEIAWSRSRRPTRTPRPSRKARSGHLRTASNQTCLLLGHSGY